MLASAGGRHCLAARGCTVHVIKDLGFTANESLNIYRARRSLSEGSFILKKSLVILDNSRCGVKTFKSDPVLLMVRLRAPGCCLCDDYHDEMTVFGVPRYITLAAQGWRLDVTNALCLIDTISGPVSILLLKNQEIRAPSAVNAGVIGV